MKKNKYLTLIVIVIFAACVTLLFLFLKTSNAYTAKEDLWQIVSGSRVEYEKGTKFSYSDKGPSNQGAGDNEYLVNTPLYAESGEEIVIPEYSVYIDKSLTKYAQIPCYTTIYTGESLKIESVEVSDGFIFDGKNSYTFLEDMVLEINGLEVEVSALSSIVVTNDKVYSLYKYDMEEIEVGTNETQSMVAKCADYRIDLLNDVMYTRENDKILIYNDPETLDPLW